MPEPGVTTPNAPMPSQQMPDQPLPKWAKVIDNETCIGCHACTTACKSENEVPLGVTRTYVKSVDVGVFPQARRAFQVTRCNQCEDAPCTHACPTSAMYQRPDGIVDFDKDACIGCKACIAACPYDAIFINPEDHTAEKCNFCAHRLDVGLEPACVVVCPTESIMVGDMNDPQSRVAEMVQREPVAVRRPEKKTRPKLFYRGAHQTTLDPLAAKRPKGGLFMWSQQQSGGHHVVSGHPDPASSSADSSANSPANSPANSSAAALLSYDVGHTAPWDWRVSLYTLTKGIAAGAYLVPMLMLLTGAIDQSSMLWQWTAPLVALIFLGITGALLIWDLEQPKRFFYIFTRPQWRSWLVRGGFILGGYGALLTAHLGAHLLDRPEWQMYMIPLGLPLAIMASVYTAYLFAQAKARDLWQNPLLPPHLLIQSVAAGAATLLPLAAAGESSEGATAALLWIVAASTLIHLGMVAGEVTLTHATAHAELANHEMVKGRFKMFFWTGIGLAFVAAAAPFLGVAVTVPAALLGLFAFEHAYVQAGQSVPLA